MRLVKLLLLVTAVLQSFACERNPDTASSVLEAEKDTAALGSFRDDYGSTYTITRSAWIQDSTYSFHIIKWDTSNQFVIAQNDSLNPTEGSLFTRIDYMDLPMDPYTWAFCLTTYNAASAEVAEDTAPANRSNPKSGCAGFPFTRMAPL